MPCQVLHDAFFKYQTKPKLTAPGEMYYEGKEFEAQITHARPGALGWACCAAHAVLRTLCCWASRWAAGGCAGLGML